MPLNRRLALLSMAVLWVGTATGISAQNRESAWCGAAGRADTDDGSDARGVGLVDGDSTDLSQVLAASSRRVRLLGRRLQPLAAEGALRSRTFARLLLTLQKGRVIVHVQDTQLPPSVPARLVPGRQIGGFRYLRVQLGSTRGGNDLIALLGHELFHALEIAQSDEVDSAGIGNLYRRIGYRTDGAHQFDTDAAREVESLIRRELSAARAAPCTPPSGRSDHASASP
jgi:hypothetical protein